MCTTASMDFMHTGARDGKLYIDRMVASQGDYIELLAQIDTLAVPICCGADVFATSNYELKPLEITVFDGSDADHAALVTHKYNHQRSVDEFKIKEIKADRPLRRDVDFKADWPWLKAVKARHKRTIELDDREAKLLEELKGDPIFSALLKRKSSASVFSDGTLANTCAGQSNSKAFNEIRPVGDALVCEIAV